MSTLEHLLVWVTLLGLLGALANPIHSLQEGIKKAVSATERREIDLDCSQNAEYAHTHFLETASGGCWSYPYAHSNPPSPFQLVLAGGRHYE